MFRHQESHSENAGDLADKMRAAFGAASKADVAVAADFEIRPKRGGDSSWDGFYTLSHSKQGWDMDFK